MRRPIWLSEEEASTIIGALEIQRAGFPTGSQEHSDIGWLVDRLVLFRQEIHDTQYVEIQHGERYVHFPPPRRQVHPDDLSDLVFTHFHIRAVPERDRLM